MDQLRLLGLTRARILKHLAEGPRTAVQLAASLKIQVSATRKHLERLRAMGAVDDRLERAGTGRPKKFYALTDEGRELFPRRYDAVLDALVALLVRDRGEAEAERRLYSVAGEFARSAGRGPKARRSRMRSLVASLKDLGFEPSASGSDGVWTLTSRNCPLLRTARAHREILCRGLHAGFLQQATGAASVERRRWIVDGDPVCTHVIRTS